MSHSEFSRIRQAKFSRFTIDRLMNTLGLLGHKVDVTVNLSPRASVTPRAEQNHNDCGGVAI